MWARASTLAHVHGTNIHTVHFLTDTDGRECRNMPKHASKDAFCPAIGDRACVYECGCVDCLAFLFCFAGQVDCGLGELRALHCWCCHPAFRLPVRRRRALQVPLNTLHPTVHASTTFLAFIPVNKSRFLASKRSPARRRCKVDQPFERV